MSRTINKQLKPGEEVGAVAILLVATLLGIVGLLALAVDVSTLGTTIAQAKANARYAALAGLEEFFASTAADDAGRKADAEARIQEILQLKQFPFAEYTAPSDSITVTTGQWFYTKKTGNINPCVAENVGEPVPAPPCFVPQAGTEAINAVRVRGTIRERARPIFSSILGTPSAAITVEAISTITPRHGCFLVDLSPSMTRETHISDSNHGATYGFYLAPLNPPSATSWHDNRWSAMPMHNYNERSGNPTDPTVHYTDDYSLVKLLDNNDYAAAAPDSPLRLYHPNPDTADANLKQLYTANPATYMVDFFRDWGDPSYDGPQPLTAIIEGLKTAVQLFRDRSVAGDKMCVIFFDHNLSWPRVVRLTDNYDYIDSLLTIRTPADLRNWVDKASHHGLFPSKDSYTNILMAVTEAERQFNEQKKAAPGLPVAQFMVLVSDGLSNCRGCDTMLAPQYDYNKDGLLTTSDLLGAENCRNRSLYGWGCSNHAVCSTSMLATDPAACGWVNANGNNLIENSEVDLVRQAVSDYSQCTTHKGCTNNYQAYDYSMRELKAYIQRQINPQLIPIHVMLVGGHVAPNTIERENPATPGKCYSDSDLRGLGESGPEFVKGFSPPLGTCSRNPWDNNSPIQCSNPNAIGAFRDMSDTNPFYQANSDMYDIARMTRGIWAPLRNNPTPCVPVDPGTCTNGAVRTADPQCRSVVDQVNGYMEQIMGQNPYTLAKSE